ncbi:MAG: hypothetical protein KAI86_10200 [Desulfobacterales bacterium]|nr:hypothetical protein [Desulfobacterales bacterium]
MIEHIIAKTMSDLKELQATVIPAIEKLEDEFEKAQEAIRAADVMLMKVTRMKIGGWLDGEYDLLSQQELRDSALAYIAARYKPDIAALLDQMSWDLGNLHPVCYIGAPGCPICSTAKEIREMKKEGLEL